MENFKCEKCGRILEDYETWFELDGNFFCSMKHLLSFEDSEEDMEE
jgi:hypothetical protein